MTKKKSDKNLGGFKDAADMIESKKPQAPRPQDGYAVYNFLDNEQNRLMALDELFSKKYINIKRYPQTDKLLLKEVYKRNLLKEDLFDKLKYDDAPLNKHLEQVFNSAFK